MNLEKTSAVAELVSAIAIVVTLAYLANETRQNTLATQATVRQSMLEEDRELLFKQMEYPFIDLGLYNPDELTNEELVQLSAWLTVFFRVRENHWLQFQNGVIDESTWQAYRTPLRNILVSDHVRSMWRARTERGEFDVSFVADVNKYISENGTISEKSQREAMGIE